MDERLPKIADVAREAGVSTATVSRALSHPDMVARSTREAVLRAVERTGYRVNLAARNLRQGRTGIIVALVPNLGNPFFSEVLAGIEKQAAAAGYGVLVADTMQFPQREERLLDYLRSDRCDGLIVLDGTLSREISAAGLSDPATPHIVFACEWNDEGDHPSITIDNRRAAALTTRHLQELGHRQIGHVSGPPGNVLTQARLQGMQSELARLDLPIRSEWMLTGDFTLESGIAAAQIWLAMPERPTAMFCASDQMAFGFIATVARAGYQIPRDVSVIGFDDIDIACCYVPSLTTVRQPRFAIGTLAASTLVARMAGESTAPIPRLEVELMVRESTARPRRG